MIKTQADGCLRSWNEECCNLRRCRPSPIQNKREGNEGTRSRGCLSLSLVSMTSHRRTEGSFLHPRYAARSEEACKSVISVPRASSSGNRSSFSRSSSFQNRFRARGRAHHDYTPNSTGTDSEGGNARVEGNRERWKQGGKHQAERVS